MLFFLFLILTFELGVVYTTTNTCEESFPENLLELSINNSVSSGTILKTYAPELNVSLDCWTCPNCLHIENASIVLRTNLRDPCVHSILCSVTCSQITSPWNTNIFITVDPDIVYGIRFNKTDYTVDIDELQELDTPIFSFRGQVRNKDCISNFKPDYTIASTTSHFVINNDEVRVNDSMLLYSPNKDNIYQLNVTAEVWNNYTILLASTTLIVKVIDVDNSDPVFSHETYTLRVPENDTSTLRTWFTTEPAIFATDGDPGINTSIRYSLLGNETLFEINRTDGSVLITHILDYEQDPEYTLYVVATEHTMQHRSATATLLIAVQDLDDHEPYFIIHQYNVSVVEHARPKTNVVQVQAKDDDHQESNSNFTYVLIIGNNIFSVNHDGYIQVDNSVLLDRETSSSINIKVGVRDLNTGIIADTTSVAITLLDINDNTPIFSEASYRFHANSTALGNSIGSISATDEDIGRNSELRYTLESLFDQELPFGVDWTTGLVNVSGTIALQGEYRFLAHACDQGPSRRCGAVTVTVVITSNTTLTSYVSFKVREHSPNGTIVGRLSQMQVDNCGHFNMSVPFECGSGGLLLSAGKLDYEAKHSYVFSADGSSNNGQERESDWELPIYTLPREAVARGYSIIALTTPTWNIYSFTVAVEVLDVNDNTPQFNEPEYLFYLEEKSSLGFIVGAVQATDMDSNNNGLVTYSIQNTSDAAFFRIDSISGQLSIGSTRLPTSIQTFQLTIVAQDHGDPILQAVSTIYVSYMTIRGNTVDVTVNSIPQAIKDRKHDIEIEIEKILNLETTIENIEPDIDPFRSHIFLSAKSAENAVPADELRTLIWKHWSKIQELFAGERMTKHTAPPTHLTTLEIALIGVSVVFFVGIMVCVWLLYRQRRRNLDYKRMYDSLTRRSSIYEEQDIIIVDEQTSDYTGSLTTQEIETDQENQTTHVYNNAVEFVTDLTKLQPVEGSLKIGAATDVALEFDTHINSANSTEALNEVILRLDELSGQLDDDEAKTTSTNVSHNDAVYYGYENAPDNVTLLNGKKSTDISLGSAKGVKDVKKSRGYENGDVVTNFGRNPEFLTPIMSSENGYENINISENTPYQNNTGLNGDNEVESAMIDIINPLYNMNESDEPVPDYDVKQVRFSVEVLHTHDNKIEPLRINDIDYIKSEDNHNNEQPLAAQLSTDSISESATPEEEDLSSTNNGDETDRVDEEINSPLGFLKIEDKDETRNVFSYVEDVTVL